MIRLTSDRDTAEYRSSKLTDFVVVLSYFNHAARQACGRSDDPRPPRTLLSKRLLQATRRVRGSYNEDTDAGLLPLVSRSMQLVEELPVESTVVTCALSNLHTSVGGGEVCFAMNLIIV